MSEYYKRVIESKKGQNLTLIVGDGPVLGSPGYEEKTFIVYLRRVESRDDKDGVVINTSRVILKWSPQRDNVIEWAVKATLKDIDGAEDSVLLSC